VAPSVRLAASPARLLGRWRRDLDASVAIDEERFGGTQGAIHAVLTFLAVAYPIAASVSHAFGNPTQLGDSLALALRPGFDVVYAESLPFMLAAVGLGLLSPALGVLFIIVFVPADLLAANGTRELETMSFQPPFGALLARAASYGLLWILAVEIPLQVRRIALGAPGTGGQSPRLRKAIAAASVTALLVFLWASALPLLIRPIFTWSGLQTVTQFASDPTWYHWPWLVGGAAIIAAVAALWPRVAAPSVATSLAQRRPGPAPSLPFVLARQTVVALMIALLLSGLMTDLPEAVVVIGGLLVAGPLLTAVLPRIPAPSFLREASPLVRGVVAAAVTLGGSAIVIVVLGKSLFAIGYLIFATLVVVAICVFRVLLEVGAGAARRASGPRSGAALRP
jgi:hypothetical protein